MGIIFVVMCIVGIVLYFIPVIVALNQNHRNVPAIFVLNLLLGWTLLGWVAALVWAITRGSDYVPPSSSSSYTPYSEPFRSKYSN